MTNTFSKYLDEVLLNLAKRIEDTQRGKTYDWEAEKQAVLSQHEKELEKARLEAKIEALSDFATDYFMKSRRNSYDEENYSRVQFELNILKSELAELKPNTTKDNER